MTAQISDRFFYDGNEFAIVGLAGQRLLTPADFDITATAIGATCWRGYYATYAAVDDGLMALVEFVVRAKNDRYPPIAGKRAHGRADARTYRDLGIPAPYSGGILIARDFIQSMYVDMGFQKPIAYATVIELLVEQGQIVAEIDQSAKVAARRAEKATTDTDSPPDLMRWVEDCFSLDYDL